MPAGKSMEDILSEARRKARERMGMSATQTKPDRVYAPGDTLLDTYQVLSAPRQGGMGSVWRVRHRKWNIELAMKQPQARYFNKESDKENFIRECEAWIELGLHPNIVSCYFIREIEGIPSIFSEWMEQGSLRDRIRDQSLYNEDPDTLLSIAIQTARGLRYAHRRGLIHQDVKPDNVLLTTDDAELVAKLADFGLSRARACLTVLEGTDTLREDMSIIAPTGGYTPAYCSMEQLNGEALTRRTDIYSWAVTVMEMYLGERLWSSGIVAGECCEEYFECARVPVPEKLQQLLKSCMAVRPEDRPHDFAEVEEALLEIYHKEHGGEYLFEDPALYRSELRSTASALNNRALSYLDMGKAEKALETWKQAMSADISNEAVIFNYALALWRFGRISLEDAIDMLSFLPNIERVAELTALLREESHGTLELNLPEDYENLPEQYDLISVPREFLPDAYASVQSAVLSPKRDLAVIADYDDLYITRRGAHYGETVRKFDSFDNSRWFTEAGFLSDGKYIYGISGRTVYIWEVESGRLISTEEKSFNFRELIRKCAGGFWLNHSPGSYAPGKAAEYILSLAESASDRAQIEKTVAFFLERARDAHEQGYAEMAMAYLDTASAYPGFENASELVRLRTAYEGGAKRLGVRGLVFLNESLSPQTERQLPDPALSERLKSSLSSYEKAFLDSHHCEEEAIYNTKITPFFASEDGSRNVYDISVWEYYDNPYQGDETTQWQGLVVYDENGKTLYSHDCWWYHHAYNTPPEHYCILSEDNRYLLRSGNGLILVDLQTGEERTILAKGHGFICITPDSRHIVFLKDNHTLCVYELSTGTEIFSRSFPTRQITDLRPLDNTSVALCINGSYRPCYFLWHYDFPESNDFDS